MLSDLLIGAYRFFFLGPESNDEPENNVVASSSRSTPINDTTNLSASCGFIFPNGSSQQQQQQQSCARTFSGPWNPNLFSASSGLENRSGGGEYDYQRQQLHAFTFGGTPGGSSTSENRFLSRFALEVCFRFVKAPSTIELRGYQIPYSGNNNGNKMGYYHQQ